MNRYCIAIARSKPSAPEPGEYYEMVVLPERFGWFAYYEKPFPKLPDYIADRFLWMTEIVEQARADATRKK
jgi:hypothetical protein